MFKNYNKIADCGIILADNVRSTILQDVDSYSQIIIHFHYHTVRQYCLFRTGHTE